MCDEMRRHNIQENEERTVGQLTAISLQSKKNSDAVEMADAVAHSLAGTGGSIIAMCVIYPLDRVRAHQQVDKSKTKQLLPFNTLAEIVRKEGWRGLYKGLPATLTAIGISSAVYFFWYHLLMKAATRRSRSLGTLANLLIAFVAGAINCTCTNPLWVVTSRLQNQRKRESEAQSPLTEALSPAEARTGALRELFESFDMDGSGYVGLSELLRVGRVYLGTMDADRDGRVSKAEFEAHLDKVMPQEKESFCEALESLRAAAAGARAAVGKHQGAIIPMNQPRYNGVADGLRKIMEEEGVAALFKGAVPRPLLTLITSPPAAS
jgi:hypothetical protein